MGCVPVCRFPFCGTSVNLDSDELGVEFWTNVQNLSVYHCDRYYVLSFCCSVNYLYSLIPRLPCVGGEKRAWFTQFAYAQFPMDFWEFGKSALLH